MTTSAPTTGTWRTKGTWRTASIGALLALVSGLLVVIGSAAAPAAGAATSFTFTGGGYGHGVGMSQWGAKGRADAGQSAAQILAAYYHGTAITAMAPTGPRVKLADAHSTTLRQAGGTIMFGPDAGGLRGAAAPGETVSVWADGTRVIGQRTAPTLGSAFVVADAGQVGVAAFTSGSPMSVGATGRQYQWGRLTLRVVTPGTLEMVLDHMTMQQYVRGIGEVPGSWPAAALQAQAIASRTYATYRLAHPQNAARFDVYASTTDQAYVGAAQDASSTWTAAVAATDGQVVTYGGTPIQAFYSASDGGATEASDYVFVASLPYLQAASDPYDAAGGANPNGSWRETYSGAELQFAVAYAGRGDVGEVQSVSIGGSVGASGRVDRATVVVTGTKGRATMTGNQLRAAVNAVMPSSRDLLSTKFAVGGSAPAAPPAPPPPPQRPPFGSFDVNVGVGGGAFLFGWAVDPDSPKATGPVAIYVNDRFAAIVTANVDRPEIAPYLPAYGGRHGWAAFVPAPGASRVCAYAMDVAPAGQRVAGTNTALGCSIVSRPRVTRRR